MKTSSFYKEILVSWNKYQRKKKVLTKNEILEENIFGNYYIKQNKQSIFYPHWAKSNLIKIKDLWDPINNNWLSGNTIHDMLINKRNWIAEYKKIIKSIPQEWKRFLQNLDVTPASDLVTTVENPQKLVLSHCNIMLHGSVITYKKLKQRDLYFLCLYPVHEPLCIKSWSTILNTNVSIDVKDFSHYIHCRKSIDLHWRILHKAVYSEEKLRIMGKSDGICKICNNCNETLCHLFYECSHLTPFWKKISDLISVVTCCNLQISPKEVIIGVDKSIKDPYVRLVSNFIIFAAKWIIWLNRNDVKFNGSPIKNHERLYKEVLHKCTFHTEILKQSSKWLKCETRVKEMLVSITMYKHQDIT